MSVEMVECGECSSLKTGHTIYHFKVDRCPNANKDILFVPIANSYFQNDAAMSLHKRMHGESDG